jgi:hypothetical protein
MVKIGAIESTGQSRDRHIIVPNDIKQLDDPARLLPGARSICSGQS